MIEDLVSLHMTENLLSLAVCSIYPSWPAAVSSQWWTTGSTTTTTCVNSTTISPTSSSLCFWNTLCTPSVCPKTHSNTLFFSILVSHGTHLSCVLLRNRSHWDGVLGAPVAVCPHLSVETEQISSSSWQSASVLCMIDKEPCSACRHTDVSVTLPFWLPKCCMTWHRENRLTISYTQ